MLADKPAEILRDDYIMQLYRKIYSDPNPRKTLTFLHLSDIHLDTEYKIGTLNKCDSYLCCREEWGYPEDPELQAKKWGSYYCDLPLVTFQNMLSHIATAHDIDAVFWTGDNSAHNTWANTNQEVIDYTLLITNELKAAFDS